MDFKNSGLKAPASPSFRIPSTRSVNLPKPINPISGEVDGYDFTGPTRFDKLFTGIAVERPKSLDLNDRTGLEGIGPEDTCDGDYGGCSTGRIREALK